MSAPSIERSLVRKAHQVLDPFHALTYLAPHCGAAFHAVGLTGLWDGYFGGRSAPLGAVEPAAVSAVFYHFKPSMVADAMAGLWDRATPEQALQARLAGMDAALRSLLPGATGNREIAEAAALAAGAAAAISVPARPLGAANQALLVPLHPHLALWQAITTLREFRGDGHVIALAEAGLDGVEALVTAVAAGIERRASIQARRGWTDDEWAAGECRLAERGLLAADGSLTETGWQVRKTVEDRTDHFAEPPLRALGARAVARMLEIVSPLTEQVVTGLRPGKKVTSQRV
ncbi:hypothetical protein AB5J62_24655 [Amycolatopsis sp. cg5]|uniref:SCO6745 family protein n=1 Tax=Amycolatopsis sp. cg5 TaxID=3238802 RepID=UPI0035237B5B